ncbi:MAG: MFS transporter [candidate division WOR-3 bacterium]
MPGPYLIQVLANTGLMAAVVYLPLLARGLGANHSQVGLLVATYQAALLVSNMLFGRWADFGDRKRFVVVGLFASALALAAHTLVRNLSGLFLVRALAGFCAGIFPAALIAYFYQYNNRLGRFSGFGSLGWGFGAVIAGAVSAAWVFPVSAFALLVTLFTAILLLRSQQANISQPFFDSRVIRRNWKLYLSFLLRHLGAFSIWTIFPLYLADIGASRLWVGLVFALNPFGQFLFMNLLERFREKLLINAGFVLSVLVFVAFGIARDFRQAVPIQIALALSWSCLYLGSLKQLLRCNPERSTAAGVLNSILSLAAVMGALLEGITGAFGYRTIMFVAAGLAAAGGLLFIVAPDPAPPPVDSCIE